jgi:predicted transcriptional regulator
MGHQATSPPCGKPYLDDLLDRARRLGVSRARLCRRADVHEVTLARTIAGKTKPNVSTLEKLSGALDAIQAERSKGDE